MAPPLANKITRSMSCLDISSLTRFSASSLVTGTSSQLSTTMEGLTGPPSTFLNRRTAFLILRSMNLSPLTPDASLVGLFSLITSQIGTAPKRQYERASKVKGGVVIMHNHPSSTRPSFSDLRSVATSEFVRASLVLCHDGTIYAISGTSPQLINAYRGTLSGCRAKYAGSLPEESIEMKALDELYRRNEVERWLRIRRL